MMVHLAGIGIRSFRMPRMPIAVVVVVQIPVFRVEFSNDSTMLDALTSQSKQIATIVVCLMDKTWSMRMR